MKNIYFGRQTGVNITDRPIGWHRYEVELNKCVILPYEQLKPYLIKANSGCSKSMEVVVRSYMKMAVSIAKYYKNLYSYRKNRLDLNDYVQAGNMGIIKAVLNFKLESSYGFTTYVTFYIRAGIQHMLANGGDFIRIKSPTQKDEEGNYVNKITPVVSIESYINNEIDPDDEQDRIIDTLKSDDQPDKNLSKEDFLIDMNRALKSLTEREESVIKMFFLEDKQLRDIGDILGVSLERTRQIKDKAITKLRSLTRSKVLSDYYFPDNKFKVRDRDREEREERQLKKEISLRQMERVEPSIYIAPAQPQPEPTPEIVSAPTPGPKSEPKSEPKVFLMQTTKRLLKMAQVGYKKEFYITENNPVAKKFNLSKREFRYGREILPENSFDLVNVNCADNPEKEIIFKWVGLEYGYPNPEWCEDWSGEKLFIIKIKRHDN